MRLKHFVAAAGGAIAMAVVPAAAATAAPKVTINVQPHTIVAGDPLLIYGRLTGPSNAGQQVVLYHRIAGQPGFTVIQNTTTVAGGFYEFTRLADVVNTNRSWYVTAGTHTSRIVSVKVQALVTLTGPTETSLLTGPAHPYTFSGTVSPAKPGATVLLQRQSATSGGASWGTIGHGVVAVGGTFSITHVFSVPGDASIRVLVRRDDQNIASPSAPIEYLIEQAQNPDLTISGTPLPLPIGQSETINGTVVGAAAGAPVTLTASTDDSGWAPVAQGTTSAGGVYTFTQAPINNTFYKVTANGKTSARLFVGVKDAINGFNVSTSQPQIGTFVTFSGTVSPDKTGHTIDLQQQNASGTGFHTVQETSIATGSAFAIQQPFDKVGTFVLRVLVPGGPDNEGTASAPVTITVTPAPLSSLPTS